MSQPFLFGKTIMVKRSLPDRSIEPKQTENRLGIPHIITIQVLKSVIGLTPDTDKETMF